MYITIICRYRQCMFNNTRSFSIVSLCSGIETDINFIPKECTARLNEYSFTCSQTFKYLIFTNNFKPNIHILYFHHNNLQCTVLDHTSSRRPHNSQAQRENKSFSLLMDPWELQLLRTYSKIKSLSFDVNVTMRPRRIVNVMIRPGCVAIKIADYKRNLFKNWSMTQRVPE